MPLDVTAKMIFNKNRPISLSVQIMCLMTIDVCTNVANEQVVLTHGWVISVVLLTSGD